MNPVQPDRWRSGFAATFTALAALLVAALIGAVALIPVAVFEVLSLAVRGRLLEPWLAVASWLGCLGVVFVWMTGRRR